MDLDFPRQMSLSQAWTLISHVKCHGLFWEVIVLLVDKLVELMTVAI
jgi:hypothetical protein